MSTHYYKNLGRYNWAGNNKSWCLTLNTPEGNISETWEEDDEPDIDDKLPSEILDLIEERLDSYWINTAREEKKKIDKMRDGIKQADVEWLEDKIKSLKKFTLGYENMLADLLVSDENL